MTNHFNDSEFEIDPENNDFELSNPTDFTDPVEKIKSRKIVKIGFITAVSVIAVSALTFAILLFADSNSVSKTPAPTQTETQGTSQPKETSEPLPEENNMLSFNPKAPKVEDGEVIIKATKNDVTAGTGHRISMNGEILKPTAECKIVRATDFCLAAQGELGETKFDIYFIKDVARTRLFEQASPLKQVEVNNATSAATIDFPVGKETFPSLVVMNDDSSGWLITVVNGDETAINTLIASIKLEVVDANE